MKDIKNSCNHYMNRANDLLLKDQDKISFAVAELEKVRGLLFDAPYEFDSEE